MPKRLIFSAFMLISVLGFSGCGQITFGPGNWTTPDSHDNLAISIGDNTRSRAYSCSGSAMTLTAGYNSDAYASGRACD